jgi:hypothetical protein
MPKIASGVYGYRGEHDDRSPMAGMIAYTVEFVDIAHREECLHDRIPNRHARRVSGP